MSNRTFRLIFDGKKLGLFKGSSPSSAAKKAYKKLSAEQMKNSTVFHQLSLKDKVLKTQPGKTSFKFELQETTKDSKKKVYGPYKGIFVKDKIKVKMAGGVYSNNQSDTTNRIQIPPPENENLDLYNKDQIEREFELLYTNPIINLKLFSKTRKQLKELLEKYNRSRATNENRKELKNKYNSYLIKSKGLFDDLYVPQKNLEKISKTRKKLKKLLKQYIKSSATNENKKALKNKYSRYTINSNISEPTKQKLIKNFLEHINRHPNSNISEPNKQKLFTKFLENANRHPIPPYMNYPSETTYLSKLPKNRTLQIARARRAKEEIQNNFEDVNNNKNNKNNNR
jgi:hypothetical protein